MYLATKSTFAVCPSLYSYSSVPCLSTTVIFVISLFKLKSNVAFSIIPKSIFSLFDVNSILSVNPDFLSAPLIVTVDNIASEFTSWPIFSFWYVATVYLFVSNSNTTAYIPFAKLLNVYFPSALVVVVIIFPYASYA